MKQRYKRFLRCSPARGLTLIEVVAAIAILGTLLVGVVLAKSRHTRQRVDARRTVQAVQLSDAQLSQWWCSREGVPIGESGVLSEDQALHWQTRLVIDSGVMQLGARVVRYEVFVDDGKVGRDPDTPLIIVDLVVPDPAVDAREAEASQEAAARTRLEAGGDA